MSSEINEKIESARIAGAGVGLTLYGLTLNEWVAVATLIYLAAQIVILVPKAYRTLKDIRQWGSK